MQSQFESAAAWRLTSRLDGQARADSTRCLFVVHGAKVLHHLLVLCVLRLALAGRALGTTPAPATDEGLGCARVRYHRANRTTHLRGAAEPAPSAAAAAPGAERLSVRFKRVSK